MHPVQRAGHDPLSEVLPGQVAGGETPGIDRDVRSPRYPRGEVHRGRRRIRAATGGIRTDVPGSVHTGTPIDPKIKGRPDRGLIGSLRRRLPPLEVAAVAEMPLGISAVGMRPMSASGADEAAAEDKRQIVLDPPVAYPTTLLRLGPAMELLAHLLTNPRRDPMLQTDVGQQRPHQVDWNWDYH